MNIKIMRIANGLLVEFDLPPTAQDPLGQRGVPAKSLQWTGQASNPPTSVKAPLHGPIFAHDATDLMGHISEMVMAEFGERK